MRRHGRCREKRRCISIVTFCFVWLSRFRTWTMTKRTLDERLRDHAREMEQNQDALRKSIAETQRLFDESEHMIQRHRQEHRDEQQDDQD